MAEKARKLSDAEFWAVLRDSAGLYSRTARAIKKKYGIEYSRQAVKQRAEKDPDQLEDIIEETKDIAEEGIVANMRSKDEKVKQRACEYYLDRKGKDRGYAVKVQQDIKVSSGEDLTLPEIEQRLADLRSKTETGSRGNQAA